MDKLKTLCLVLIAASLLVLGVRGNFGDHLAAAQTDDVICETWSFDWSAGKEKGRNNVEAHRAEMSTRLNAHRANGYTYAVYSNSFPIRNAFNGAAVGEAGVLCLARSR